MKPSKKTAFVITKGQHLKKPEKKPLALTVKIVIFVAALVLALGIAVLALIKHGGQAPEVKHAPTTPHAPLQGGDPSAQPTDDPDSTPPTDAVRDKNKFTFAVFGTDEGGGNTDVIMIATLDTKQNTLNVVNIPRDTLVNVSWSIKKVNSLYAYMKGPEGAVTKLADILGYEVDFYAVVNLKAFEAVVDAIGGVDFNVPRNMNYDDPAQNLSIHISKGQQHLSGKDALGVVRFRRGNNNTGYASGDIGRIETQQQFLSAAAEQILAKKSSINVTSIANIFLKYVKTNLELSELIWFSKELFKLDAAGVSFTTLPGNYIDSINGDSYVTIYLNEWMELINDKLNPFSTPITLKNLSIYTRDSSDKLYVTDGHYEGNESWGRRSSGSSSGSSSGGSSGTTPKPSTTPSGTTPGDSETPVSPDDAEVSPDITPPETALPPETDAPPQNTDLPTPSVPALPQETPDDTSPEVTPPEPSIPEMPTDSTPTPPEIILTPPPATPPDSSYPTPE
ncbi:MAG: LCP family protein [Oscillospiraceae bacterium]|jgi:LCP family protein required for cell wall assembly|nr:LCP family protein [Oscillospiraceae bacterium]